jgi:glycosyltransferase involved in cell wall biosynthesis
MGNPVFQNLCGKLLVQDNYIYNQDHHRVEILPKISIVTINFNQGDYLEQTILSVLDQQYPNLEYMIIDGGSTDQSVDIIKKYASQLTYWVSEKDEGMYHALQKGFARATGDIMAWINSDDFYLPGSFAEVVGVFNQHPQVKWVRSLPLECTQGGEIFNRIFTPWARWSKYRYLTNDFQFIQQESCFWKKEVWEEAGACMHKELRYAGDMELWARFFRKEKLYTVNAHWAVFRHREQEQISKKYLKQYMGECVGVIQREKEMLNTVTRRKVAWLSWFKPLLGFFFFLDVPLLKIFYTRLFEIPPLIGTKRLPAYTPGYRKLVFPPFILGRWVVQWPPYKWR